MDKLDLADIDWHCVLPRYGIPEGMLVNRPGPCPVCQTGKDRFRFDNKQGRGTFYCNRCGSGTGLRLIQLMTGQSFADIYAELRNSTFPQRDAVRISHDSVQVSSQEDLPRKRQRLNSLWTQGRPLDGDDPVSRYLLSRIPGLDLSAINNRALRLHPSLDYIEPDAGGGYRKLGTFPAMLAKVVDGNGIPISIHRTYLTDDGKKADVPSAKKLMTGVRKLDGAAIHLNDVPDCRQLAVCEGIETGLAVLASYRELGREINVWSLINCMNMAKAVISPDRFDTVTVYADNDAIDESRGYSPGIHHAGLLRERLVRSGINARVKAPRQVGSDWADVWFLYSQSIH